LRDVALLIATRSPVADPRSRFAGGPSSPPQQAPATNGTAASATRDARRIVTNDTPA
jgi:hypothetical protein